MSSAKKIEDEIIKDLNIHNIKDLLIKVNLLPRRDKMYVSREIIEMDYKIPSVRNASFEELLNSDISVLGLSKPTYDIIKNFKINTIGDLVSLRDRDLRIIPFLGVKKSQEVINKVHNLGLVFSNEAIKIYEYSKEINDNLKTSK